MATFKVVIRGRRNDGFYPVYIRVSHKSDTSYIKTSFAVSERGLKRTYNKVGKEKIEVSDVKVLRECMDYIAEYVTKLNNVDSDKMSVQEITNFLLAKNTEISFSDFANDYISEMINAGRESSTCNYKMAVKRLHEFLDKDNILFEDLTFSRLTNWIESMMDSPRKRNLYPSCIKTMYSAAILKFNDEDRDIIRIKKNPFARIKIPSTKPAAKKSLKIGEIRRFFSWDVQKNRNEKISQDVCKLVFCLAGINTADLYDLPINALSEDGTLHYRRKKTRDKSLSGAYTEIKVPKIIQPLLEEYRGIKRLFIFSENYRSSNIFADAIIRGCRKICKNAELKNITPYSFRHSWATIAINDCNASMDDVAFALNHSSAYKVTNIYIRPDYSRIDKLNRKVLGKIFNKRIHIKTLKKIAGIRNRRK